MTRNSIDDTIGWIQIIHFEQMLKNKTNILCLLPDYILQSIEKTSVFGTYEEMKVFTWNELKISYVVQSLHLFNRKYRVISVRVFYIHRVL